jgi:excisionase family DNA binding protein
MQLIQPQGSGVGSAASGRSSGSPRPAGGSDAGQAFADLLLVGALAAQAPAALLSVRQAGGAWSPLSYGLESKLGLDDRLLYEAIAVDRQPVELPDLMGSLGRSPLVAPPHSMRWAYGVSLRDEAGAVLGVVVLLDRWLRQVSRREQLVLTVMARQLGAQLRGLRRVAAPAGPAGPLGSAGSGAAAGPARTEGRSGVGPAGLTAEGHQLLRSHEVAVIFDVTERTVINWAAAGKLPSLRTIGGHLRFRRDDVLRLLDDPRGDTRRVFRPSRTA